MTDGTCVISYWGSRGLHCYDMQGNLKWEKDGAKENEKIIVTLIEDYLKHREALPKLEEELPKKDYSILTEEEKKKREEEEKKK